MSVPNEFVNIKVQILVGDTKKKNTDIVCRQCLLLYAPDAMLQVSHKAYNTDRLQRVRVRVYENVCVCINILYICMYI